MIEDGALAAAPRVSGQASTPLESTAQFLTFDAGMYAVDFHAPRPALTNVGLALPCARLDAMPQSVELEGRAFVSMMSEGGWIAHGDLPTLIRVVGGKAGVLLTIYKSTGGMPSPELRIRYIRDDLQFAPVETPAEAEPRPAAPAPLAENILPVQVLVHAQERGDMRAGAGEWAGIPGSRLLLEGFAILPEPGCDIAPGELEYQGILGHSWNTPWFPAGEFCGSRGMALPILGLRLRLTGRAAEHYQCAYAGSFIGLGEIGPMHDGEACEADGKPMNALRVVITRREAPAAVADDAAGVSPPARKPRRGGA